MPRHHPETILLDGDIHTMEAARPRARALAVTGGRITALGSDAEIAALAGPGTRVIHAGGRVILPGFHDSHLHVMQGGQRLARVADLSAARTLGELQAILSAFARTHDRQWVEGGFYDGARFGAQVLSRAVLDQAVPDRPVMIVAADAHGACVNSRACLLAGLDEATPDPPGGLIRRDAAGRPTGVLAERAVTWMAGFMPEVTDRNLAEGAAFALAHANRHGITTAQDASITGRFARVYHGMAEAGGLTARVLGAVRVDPAETAEGAVARLAALRRTCSAGLFRVHAAKFFLDGVLESRTAAMLEDYADAEGGNAPLMFAPGPLAEAFAALDAARFQIHVHAIGDLAVRAALDGFAAARQANGAWASWHQIAHVQCLDPGDVPRFAELGVMANIQPLWARLEPALTDLALPMIGPARGRWLYAFGALRRAGARLALSSDWTVSTLNPFEIMATAMTRQPGGRADVPVFLPGERLSLEDCLAGYTIHPAMAAWHLEEVGTLSLGKNADFIMLDRDIFTLNPHDFGAVRVLMTLLDGKAVWEA